MPIIPYDPTLAALLHPDRTSTVFGNLVPGAVTARVDAICAECSRLAYVHFESSDADWDQLQVALKAGGLNDPERFSDPLTGAQAFAALFADTGRPLIVFRGTQPDRLQDLIIILSVLPIPWNGPGLVHSGFATQFHRLRDGLQSWLEAHGNGKPPVVTGHSLGAALATLAASHWPGTKLVSFGSPRVGNPEFTASIPESDVTRYVDCCDLVVEVPLEGHGLYAHCGTMQYIDSRGVVCPGVTEADAKLDRKSAREKYNANEAKVRANCAGRDFADHAPINYVRAFFQTAG